MLLGFGALAVIATWPVARDFGTFITAPLPGNDQLGYLFDFRYSAEHGIPVIRDYVQGEVAVPFGRPASAAANLTLIATIGPAALITKVAGPIVAYNVLTLAGLALSGAAMYLLVRWLGLGRGPAVWAGLVFVLFPYHLFAATAFVTVVPYEFLPLVLLALVAWTVRPGVATGAGVVAAIALCWLTFPYFGAMAIVMAAVGLAVAFALHGRRDGWAAGGRRLAGLTAGVLAGVAAPLFIIAAINSGGATGALARDPADLAILGAEVSDYVVPQANNPFLGGIVGPEWAAHGSVGGERLAFVGWVTAALALAGVAAAIACRRRLAPRLAAVALIAVPAVVVLVAFSLRSPYELWGSHTFPSRLLYEVFDFVRAPGRFVVAVMVCLCALGAVGLHLIGARMGTVGRHALVAGAIVLSGAELGMGLPLPVTPPTFLGDRPAEQQPSWQWLRAHPGGAVMEYPEVGNTSVSRYYMYGWAVHGHPIVNAVHGPGDPGGEFTRTVLDPRPVEVPAVLAGAGVRYVVLNRWAYDALGLRLPRAMPDGFTRVAGFPDGTQIWRVDAAPSAAQTYFTATGWTPQRLEFDGRRVVNWRTLTGTGVVRMRVAEPGTYRVRLDAAPTGPPVDLTVTGPSGGADTVRVARRGDVTVAIDLPAGDSDVRVSVPDPAAASVVVGPWVAEGPS